MIFLDTNVVIAAINRRPPQVRHRLEAAIAARAEIPIPAVALYKLWNGVHKSARPDANAAALAAFLALGIGAAPFESADAAEAGNIRAAMAHCRSQPTRANLSAYRGLGPKIGPCRNRPTRTWSIQSWPCRHG